MRRGQRPASPPARDYYSTSTSQPPPTTTSTGSTASRLISSSVLHVRAALRGSRCAHAHRKSVIRPSAAEFDYQERDGERETQATRVELVNAWGKILAAFIKQLRLHNLSKN